MPAGSFAKANMKTNMSGASSTLRKTSLPYSSAAPTSTFSGSGSSSGGAKINLASAF